MATFSTPSARSAPRLRNIRTALFIGVVGACGGDPIDKSSVQPGAPQQRPRLAVFPSADLVVDGHLRIPEDLLPVPIDGTPVPVERLAWRTGLSPVQTTVFDLEDPVDPAGLPTATAAQRDGAVQLWDLDEGRPLACFAELDAAPGAEDHPRLLVRPLEPMTVGHSVAVVLTDDLRAPDGSPWTGPDWYRSAADGHTPVSAEGELLPHYVALDDQLDAVGAPARQLAEMLPIGDGTAPLINILDELQTPTAWAWTDELDADAGDVLPAGTWRQLRGTFTTTDWLVDDAMFAVHTDGHPEAQGAVEAELFVMIPDSVRDAEPSTVPVWIFGHGIFSSPETYLADLDDPSHVVALADAAGAIVVATTWRGLTRSDLGVAINVGTDFGSIPELTDKLVQGIANTAAMIKLIHGGGLLDDPALGGLGDPNTLRWYGISLGAINGATLLANDPTIPHGVLHVGGSVWSTMLERSSNWAQFEVLIMNSVPEAADRQRLYAASQLFWDGADPALYADGLQGRSVLWQKSVGDEQVPNLTTDIIARAAGATVVTPVADLPADMATATAPLQGPALAHYDPMLPLPTVSNRPAAVTGAHGTPRKWDSQAAQTLRFLDADDPGVVVHPCGDAPCTADNTDAVD